MKHHEPEDLDHADSFLTDTPAFQGKLNSLCDFLQSCNQVPTMCCQPRDKVSWGTGVVPMG